MAFQAAMGRNRTWYRAVCRRVWKGSNIPLAQRHGCHPRRWCGLQGRTPSQTPGEPLACVLRTLPQGGAPFHPHSQGHATWALLLSQGPFLQSGLCLHRPSWASPSSDPSALLRPQTGSPDCHDPAVQCPLLASPSSSPSPAPCPEALPKRFLVPGCSVLLLTLLHLLTSRFALPFEILLRSTFSTSLPCPITAPGEPISQPGTGQLSLPTRLTPGQSPVLLLTAPLVRFPGGVREGWMRGHTLSGTLRGRVGHCLCLGEEVMGQAEHGCDLRQAPGSVLNALSP